VSADVDGQGRPEPPLADGELASLLGFLDYQRATLAWKCGGIDPPGMRATVGASSMTLGGLLKHLAYFEDDWFSRALHGHNKAPPWDTVDWKAPPDTSVTPTCFEKPSTVAPASSRLTSTGAHARPV
jgi:hypothetical protein